MSRPSEADFDPYSGCLDAQCAWRNFGGLSIDEAFEKFSENPLRYQEDFMWMGGAAFKYYFPVLERYIRKSRVGSGEVEDEVDAVHILADCVKSQFDTPTEGLVMPLRTQILDLAAYVQDNISRYYAREEDLIHAAKSWQALQTKLESIVEPN